MLPSAVAATRGDSELLRQLHEVPEGERGSFLTEYLRYEVQNFLRLAQPPAATSRFLELGTDSLMAVEFSNRLLAPVRWRVHDQRHRGIRLSDDRVARRVPGRAGARVG